MRHFRSVDKDESGDISPSEFSELLKDLGFKVSELRVELIDSLNFRALSLKKDFHESQSCTHATRA